MPAVELAVQTILVSATGITPAYEAIEEDGNYFLNDDQDVFVEVVNGSAGAVTVHFSPSVQEEGGLGWANREVDIPAGETRLIGPFPNALYGQILPPDGVDPRVIWIYADTWADITIGAFQLPRIGESV